MKDNGSKALRSDKVKVCKYGLMALCTKVTGLTTKPTAKEDLFMLMEMSMTVTGWTIKLMASEHTAIQMELNTEVNGKKTNNMAKDQRHGPTALPMKDTMSKDASTDKAALPGLIRALTLASSLRTTSKDTVSFQS